MSSLEPLEKAFVELGPPSAVFKPPKLRFVVGFLVMGLMAAMSFLAYVFSPDPIPQGPRNEDVAILIMGLGSLLIAIGIAAYGSRLRRQRIFVCPGGLVEVKGSHAEIYPWQEIARVTENTVGDSIGFFPAGTYRAATVQRADGAELLLTRNRIRGVGELIDLIQDQVWARRSNQQVGQQDPRLTRIVDAWPTLPEEVRADIMTTVENAAAEQASRQGASNKDVHVDLYVTQDQIARGDTVTLDVPDVGSFRIKLPEGVQTGMAVRLRNALPNQGSLIARVRIGGEGPC